MKALKSFLWIFTFIVLGLAGCATEIALRDAQSNYTQGKFEESLQILYKALEKDPTDARLRTAYLTFRDNGIQKILIEAENAMRNNDVDSARKAYQRILAIDHNNFRAQTGLQEIERAAHHKEIIEKVKTDIQKKSENNAIEQLRSVLSEDADNLEAKTLLLKVEKELSKPTTESKIDKSLQKTVSIDFKDATLKQIFEVFARTTSVNFVFDKDVRTEQRTTVFLNGINVKEALEVVLFTNQLEQRRLDTNTILIFPDTPAKRRDYQQLTIRGFFLANGDPEQVANALKLLLKMRDVVVDKRQNLITVRDTKEAVKMAEKLVTLYDLPEPEVMLEVEILEINRTRLTELGIKYPDQLTLTPLTTVGGDTVTVDDLKNISSRSIGAGISPLVINAKRQTGDINLLANPRIRARNRETAKILIGDKVPNITTTSTATGFVASNVQYLDVGLKLDVVPTITVDNEISIKISLEVSNIANQITTKDGSVTYQIGTRSASTVLRLKDGENQVLAGLISDDDRRSANKIPGFGDLPIIGKLFGSNLVDAKKTEIVLSITPRLVRNNIRPELKTIEFDSGTEAGMRGLSGVNTRQAGSPDFIHRQSHPIEPHNVSQLNESNSNAPPNGTVVPPPSSGGIPPEGASPQSSSTLSIPSARWEAPTQIKIGDTFAITLSMNSSQPLTGIPLALGYDPTKLEIINVQEGNLLSQNGGTATYSQRIDRNSGQIFLTGTRNIQGGNNGATGDGSLITVTAKAIGTPGVTAIRVVTLALLGLNGATIAANVPAPLNITISP